VWAQSKHTNLTNTQLNSTMRLITGNFQPTHLSWQPVLSNIEPPAAADRLLIKIEDHEESATTMFSVAQLNVLVLVSHFGLTCTSSKTLLVSGKMTGRQLQ